MEINLSKQDRNQICIILSYDIALNKKALEIGLHPVSGFKASDWHRTCIEENQRLISLLGGEEIKISRGMLGYPPCKSCLGYGLWAIGHPNPMGEIDAGDGYLTLACPECGANVNPIEDIVRDENLEVIYHGEKEE